MGAEYIVAGVAEQSCGCLALLLGIVVLVTAVSTWLICYLVGG